jgi:2-polyprenyl-3-methyl-5-hydroxy-6-metoxy-1,4-benzoquinol methylase
LVYLDYRSSPEELRTFYSAAYFQGGDERQGYHDYQALGVSMTATARLRLQDMARLCSPGRLLEVGCAMGFFLRVAAQAGWDVQGVELSDYAAQAARDQFELPVTTGRLEDAQFPSASFDAVAIWDVIEHVPEPVSLVCEVARVLRPGGLVALSTGDVDSLLARLSGSRWHLYNFPQHLSFFSPVTVSRLLESVGLHVVRLHHAGAMYTLEYIAHRLKTVCPNRLTAWLSQILHDTWAGRWSIWLNLWDIMTVSAIKK